MILPVKFLPDGGWKFTGYEGLASHGGTLGLIIALWMYCRKTKMHYMDVLDMIAVATPVTACCIRLANLMNSEIIGLTEIFVFRFFIEFLKEDQVDFESAMTLNMGQWLSIPFILIGVYFMCFHGKKTAGK